MRLIDADEIFPNGVFIVNGGNPMTSLDELINRINNAPTVDAVVLPCRPGDHVFRLCGTKKNRYVAERIVSSVTLCGNGEWMILSTTHDSLGKTVFLTREEAEAALVERKKKDA